MAEDKLQVVFDLNIILDVLQERKDFYAFLCVAGLRRNGHYPGMVGRGIL